MNKTLVVNAGSSSIKWAIFDTNTLNLEYNGIAERIGIDGVLKMNSLSKNVDLKNHEDAVKEIITFWNENKIIESLDDIKNIGFRVVHGANYYNKSTILNQKSIEIIEKCSAYAPLHNPSAILTIKAFEKFLPNSKKSASFDTAFHTTIPLINSIYPINKKLSDELKIKKYGFHGISHKFITLKLSKILNKNKVNFINLHLGNGSSICAIKNSLSFDTSMGFTPLAGIMMGTRSGDIDPSIHEFVCKEKNISIEDFTNILNKKSGLLGISNISNDLRDIVKASENNNQDAIFAIDLYAQKAADYVASYANKIATKLDAIVFTGGIGENSLVMRRKIIEKLHFAKIDLDFSKNDVKAGQINDYSLISTPESEIKIFVIRTNEELLIAQDAINLTK